MLPLKRPIWFQFTSPAASSKTAADFAFWTACLCTVALFWLTRLTYWASTSERLFSDMLDFDLIARRVLHNFCYDFNPFFKSYTTPTIPSLRAAQIMLFGDTINAWQWFQTMLLFIGLVWLAWEVCRASGSRWLALILVLVVALSRPSIFWSLKLAREGLGEGFAYLAMAAGMAVLRTWSRPVGFLAGFIFCSAMHIRGTFILALPFVLLILLWPATVRIRPAPNFRRRAAICIAFCAGLAVIWLPWAARSYRLYRHPVLLTTMAPYVFFWDLGVSKVTLPDGSTIEVSAQGLQKEAPTRFENDYQASQYAAQLMKAYLRQNAAEVPQLFARRILNTIYDPDVHLTTVSRSDIFPEARWDENLVDKTPGAILFGVVGLFAAAFALSGRLMLLPILSVIPWLNAAIMIGYARMLESFIPVIIFGNLLLAAVVWKSLRIFAASYEAPFRPTPRSIARCIGLSEGGPR